jgi:hypothetical protein
MPIRLVTELVPLNRYLIHHSFHCNWVQSPEIFLRPINKGKIVKTENITAKKMMSFNVVTIFSASERNDLKKAFQAKQKHKAFLATPTYYPKYPPPKEKIKTPKST